MLQVERDLAASESAFLRNDIENRKLEQLHSQFASFNLQATLVVGFAFSTFNADNLVALSDDNSKFCIYKQPFAAHMYVVLIVAAIIICMSCVMNSYYVVYRSQKSANEVSVKHTIALVRTHKGSIMSAYFCGMGAFFVAFLSLLWIYFGQHNWRPLDGPPGTDPRRFVAGANPGAPGSACPATPGGITGNPPCDGYAANGWDVPVLITETGVTLVTCLNPWNSTQQAMQRDIGFSVALSGTLTAVLGVGLACVAGLRIRASFRAMERMVDAAVSNQQQGARRADAESRAAASRSAREESPTAEMLPVGVRH